MDKTTHWKDYITYESLPNEDLKLLATLFGINVPIVLMEEYPGTTIIIPQKATYKYKVKYVLEHYDGTKKTRLKLSRMCGFSENLIYKIVRNRNKK